MLKKLLLSGSALALLSAPVLAQKYNKARSKAYYDQHRHHKTKLEKDIAKVIAPVGGGAAGYAVGGPIGAAVGVGAGYVVTHKLGHPVHHTAQHPAFAGYRYSNGYYYDGYGRKFTLDDLLNRWNGVIRRHDAQVPSYPGYIYRGGYYWDRGGHKFTLDQLVKKHGTSNYRQRVKIKASYPDHGTGHPPTYEFVEKYGKFDYPGFTYHDGVYWDDANHWYAPSYMYRYYGPSVYRKRK